MSRTTWESRRLYPHGGHYRPGDEHITHILRFARRCWSEYLGSVEVDGQHDEGGTPSAARRQWARKKKDRPHFLRGDALLSFLELKALDARPNCSMSCSHALPNLSSKNCSAHRDGRSQSFSSGAGRAWRGAMADAATNGRLFIVCSSEWLEESADDNTDFEFEGDEPIPLLAALYTLVPTLTLLVIQARCLLGVSTQGAERRKTSSDFDDSKF